MPESAASRPSAPGQAMTPAEIAAEHALTAKAWAAYCEGQQGRSSEEAPIAVLLLSALAEPPGFGERFTGDLVTDVLGILQGTVSRWQGREEALETGELRLMARRLDLVIELRRRART